MHVVSGAVRAMFRLTARGEDGNPDYGRHMDVTVDDFGKIFIPHPDEGVDLAMIPIHQFAEHFHKKMGVRAFFAHLSPNKIATAADLAELNAIENVTMIGYPNAIWDEKNNLPVIRRGTTATPPWIDYNGKSEFMIDIAVFGGSSGSPVFLFDEGGWVDRNGNTNMGGGRLKLLGVLWGGPVYSAEGNIEARPVPTDTRPVSLTSIRLNLGYCIKAERILEFVPVLEKLVES